jgi:hypothetical protein
MHKGSCLCGAVSFEIEGDLPPADACHCSQCRKQSGHYWASTEVAESDITIHGAEKIGWFQSSERIRRGFCSVCGSVLFWVERGGEFEQHAFDEDRSKSELERVGNLKV